MAQRAESDCWSLEGAGWQRGVQCMVMNPVKAWLGIAKLRLVSGLGLSSMRACRAEVKKRIRRLRLWGVQPSSLRRALWRFESM